MNTILTKEGYLLLKKSINSNLLNEIKNDLTVQPVQMLNYNSKVSKFKVYQENDEYISIPKYYGLNKIGKPTTNSEKLGENIDIEFKSELRDKQKEIINTIIPYLDKNDGGVLCLPCGYGKCLAYDTEILMFDGSIKKVQDIQVNDLLMGDDSCSRTVLSLATGSEMMYNIYDDYNNKYCVNESHILSLYDTKNYKVIDISLKNYNQEKNKYLKGYRIPIYFDTKIVNDPFKFGHELPNKYDYIPDIYKINSINNRTLLLFGICTSIGYMNNSNYEIESDKSKLLKDIVFVARSIGYICNYINENKIIIMPSQNNYNCYNLRIEKVGIDNYYGFEINGNKRFILGDFSVTHNTILSLYIITQLKVKTLVIVHKSFLLNQWRERAEEFTNGSVGIIQRDKIDIDNKQIVIGMLQSIAKDKYDSDIFKDFSIVIFDEAHHAPSEYFSRALPIISCKKTIALSATPKRNDRLEKVLFWYFGNIMYKLDNITNTNVLVYNYNYKLDHEKFREFKLRTGDINRAKTINKITTIGRRNKFIINIMIEMIEPLRKIIVLSDRIDHLKLLKERLNKQSDITTSYYIGGMKIDKLQLAEKAQVIFATYSMAAEALDIPELNTLFMVTPRREVEQAVGRILRKVDINTRPIIYDFVDQLPTFINQNIYRKKFYNKMKFEQIIINVNENEIISSENIINFNENEDITYDFID